MNQKQVFQIVAAVAVIGVAGWLILSSFDNHAARELEHHKHYLCMDDTCAHEITYTIGEIASLHDHGEYMRCDACGNYDIKSAFPCPECAMFVTLGDFDAVPEFCNHCNAKIGAWDPSKHRHGPDGSHIASNPEALQRAARGYIPPPDSESGSEPPPEK